MNYTLYVKYEGEIVPCMDSDDPMDMTMGMLQLQLAGIDSGDMYAIDNRTNNMLMADTLYK